MGLLGRLVLAVVVGVVVTLACILIGAILVTLKIELAVTVGNFIKTYGGVFGVLAALWYFFSNADWFNRSPR